MYAGFFMEKDIFSISISVDIHADVVSMAIVKQTEDDMATLNELNALRTAAGMKPLKVWKASKKALDEAIAKLQSKTTTTQQLEASKKAVESPINVKRTEQALNAGGVTISEIAADLKINDKVARAKLRRRKDIPRLPGKAWTFAPEHVATIKAILRQDNRKKGGE